MTQRGKTLAARAEATQRVYDQFRTRPMDWASGATCLHLARAQARAMGHRGLPRIPDLTGPIDALRALRAQGAATVADLLDQHFPRLDAPAFARVGDLVVVPGGDGGDGRGPIDAIGIWDGVANVLMWHDSDLSGVKPVMAAQAAIIAAWRL